MIFDLDSIDACPSVLLCFLIFMAGVFATATVSAFTPAAHTKNVVARTTTTTMCSSSSDLYHSAATFYYADYWGLSERPATSGSSAGHREEETRFVTAVCNAAAGDGKASVEERNFIKGVFALKGFLPSVVEKIDSICDEAEKKSLKEVATDAADAMTVGTLSFASSCIIFEAIKAAGEDGLDKEEMAAIHAIAKGMGVDKEKVLELKALVDEEEALKKRRIALCLPDHPCLQEKYQKQSDAEEKKED